jgi:hypothetical protein
MRTAFDAMRTLLLLHPRGKNNAMMGDAMMGKALMGDAMMGDPVAVKGFSIKPQNSAIHASFSCYIFSATQLEPAATKNRQTQTEADVHAPRRCRHHSLSLPKQ